MGIVTEKKFLTTEELQELNQIQKTTQSIIIELGEIELTKIQLDGRKEKAKNLLNEISNKEQLFTQSILEKYGPSNINPETGEITKVD